MYLSSFRVGNCPHRLVELARGGMRAAVIANAMDAAPPEIRTDGIKRELSALTALGLHRPHPHSWKRCPQVPGSGAFGRDFRE
jgi:hypothetical protein